MLPSFQIHSGQVSLRPSEAEAVSTQDAADAPAPENTSPTTRHRLGAASGEQNTALRLRATLPHQPPLDEVPGNPLASLPPELIHEIFKHLLPDYYMSVLSASASSTDMRNSLKNSGDLQAAIIYNYITKSFITGFGNKNKLAQTNEKVLSYITDPNCSMTNDRRLQILEQLPLVWSEPEILDAIHRMALQFDKNQKSKVFMKTMKMLRSSLPEDKNSTFNKLADIILEERNELTPEVLYTLLSKIRYAPIEERNARYEQILVAIQGLKTDAPDSYRLDDRLEAIKDLPEHQLEEFSQCIAVAEFEENEEFLKRITKLAIFCHDLPPDDQITGFERIINVVRKKNPAPISLYQTLINASDGLSREDDRFIAIIKVKNTRWSN